MSSTWLICVILIAVVYMCMQSKESYATYDIGNWWTSNDTMPGYFEGTKQRCTDGCMYRIANDGVYVDEQCTNYCMNKYPQNNQRNELSFNLYMNELTKSINDRAITYDHY